MSNRRKVKKTTRKGAVRTAQGVAYAAIQLARVVLEETPEGSRSNAAARTLLKGMGVRVEPRSPIASPSGLSVVQGGKVRT